MEHLYNVLGANYRYTVDHEGKNYCGLILEWNYKLGFIDIAMPKIVPVTRKKLNYILKVSS